MSQYTPGVYHVIEFDRHGQPMRTTVLDGGVLAAAAHGQAQLSRAACHSYVTLRVIANSLLKPRNPWETPL